MTTDEKQAAGGKLTPDQKAAKAAIDRRPKDQGGMGLKGGEAYAKWGGDRQKYTLACKLDREGHSDLTDQVATGSLSLDAALVQAGMEKPKKRAGKRARASNSANGGGGPTQGQPTEDKRDAAKNGELIQSKAVPEVETEEERLKRLESEIADAVLVWARARLKQAIHVGGLMREAHGIVSHGEWESWVKARGFNPRTASNWMRLHKAYEDGKSELNSDLTTTSALKLLTETNVQQASKKPKKSRGAGGGKGSNESAAKANPNPQALQDAERKGREQAEREAEQRAEQAAQGHSAQVNAVNDLLNDARDTIKVQDQENNRLRAENENLRNASNSEAGAKPETQPDKPPQIPIPAGHVSQERFEALQGEVEALQERVKRADALSQEKQSDLRQLREKLSSFDQPGFDSDVDEDESGRWDRLRKETPEYLVNCLKATLRQGRKKRVAISRLKALAKNSGADDASIKEALNVNGLSDEAIKEELERAD